MHKDNSHGAVSTKRKKREYNHTYKSVLKQLQHATLLLQQEQQRTQVAHDAQLLLAEAILMHRVMYKLIKPLQHCLAQQSIDSPLYVEPSWARMVQLAEHGSPLLRGALEATPEQVARVTASTPEDMQQLIMTKMNQALLLLELLAPERYPEGLISKQPFTHQQQSAGGSGTAHAAAAGDGGDGGNGSWAPQQIELEQAAAQLLGHLQELHQLTTEIVRTSNLLLLHAPHALMAVASTNVATGLPVSALTTTNHYASAVRRIRLTSRQVQHFQIMLQQYNRMTQQQAREGQQLLEKSENSLTLQSSLSGAPSVQQSGGGGSRGSSQQGSGGADNTQECGALPKQPGAAGPAAAAAAVSAAAAGADVAAAAGAAGEPQPAETVSLEELLERHMLERLDLVSIVGAWACNTLTPWQIAEFLVACYPFFGLTGAFVELAGLLVPCDEPRGYINAECCEAAAQAAALAAELGYLDTHPFIQQRCAALEFQLEWAWALQEAQRH